MDSRVLGRVPRLAGWVLEMLGDDGGRWEVALEERVERVVEKDAEVEEFEAGRLDLLAIELEDDCAALEEQISESEEDDIASN